MITGTNLDLAKQPKVAQISWRGGDVLLLSPFGHMLVPPYTKVLGRWKLEPSVPFVSLNIKGVGAYVGGKGVGWDDAYKAWLPEDLWGQDFVIITARFFTDGASGDADAGFN